MGPCVEREREREREREEFGKFLGLHFLSGFLRAVHGHVKRAARDQEPRETRNVTF